MGFHATANSPSNIPSPFNSSTVNGAQWHTPAEMSGSFSGEEIRQQTGSTASPSRSMEGVMLDGSSFVSPGTCESQQTDDVGITSLG